MRDGIPYKPQDCCERAEKELIEQTMASRGNYPESCTPKRQLSLYELQMAELMELVRVINTRIRNLDFDLFPKDEEKSAEVPRFETISSSEMIGQSQSREMHADLSGAVSDLGRAADRLETLSKKVRENLGSYRL